MAVEHSAVLLVRLGKNQAARLLPAKQNGLAGRAPKASAMFRRSFPLLLLVVAVCCATRLSVSGEPRIKENVPSYLSASAVYSLVTGQAGDYHAEYQQRLSMLKDETLQVVEFTPYSDPVELLYYGDLTQDPDYPWINRPLPITTAKNV